MEPGNQEGFQNVLEARELLLADGGNAELIAPVRTPCISVHAICAQGTGGWGMEWALMGHGIG